MADVITRFKLETTQYDSALRNAAQQLNEYGSRAMAAGREFQKFTKGQAEVAREFGNIAVAAKNPKDKVKELVAAFNEAAKAYNALTKEQQQSDWGKGLAESLQTLKVRISDAKKELYDFGDGVKGGGGLTGALDQLAGKFGLNIQQLAGWGAAIGAAKVALDVAKDAFFQSESNIDEWGRTVEGAKGAYDVFLDTLNNGNWSNFFSNLTTAVQGARDLYDSLDRLGSIKSNNAAAIAIVQQEIAKLRLLKQSGEDVDAQIKDATARLSALQKQSVDAGKKAGRDSIGNIIRNEYNTQKGANPLSGGSINRAVDDILKNGQDAFDKYKRTFETLEKKAADTRVTAGSASATGVTSGTERYTNLEKLTDEERKQYFLAKAITEGETRIQQGIALYAQSVQEGTASAREEFKGNRYALTGSGGSGGGKTGGGGSVTPLNIKLPKKSYVQDFSSDSMLANNWMESLASVNSGMFAELKAKQVANINRFAEVNDIPLAFQLDESATQQQIQDALDNINMFMGENPIQLNFATGEIESAGEIATDGKKAANTWKDAASAVQSVGSAFSQIEDPGVKAMGTVMQAIASIALGFAQASASPAVTGTGWGWLAWLGAGAAAMATTIATIHSLTGFAEGGIVQGNAYSGDNVGPVMLDAGEVILNRSQQGTLAEALTNGNNQGGAVGGTPYVTGEKIVLGINNYGKKQGWGELVFSRR